MILNVAYVGRHPLAVTMHHSFRICSRSTDSLYKLHAVLGSRDNRNANTHSHSAAFRTKPTRTLILLNPFPPPSLRRFLAFLSLSASMEGREVSCRDYFQTNAIICYHFNCLCSYYFSVGSGQSICRCLLN